MFPEKNDTTMEYSSVGQFLLSTSGTISYMFCKDECLYTKVTPVPVTFTDSGTKVIQVFFTEVTLYART